MTPALVTSIVSLLVALGSLAGWLVARGKAERSTESQVIRVTVDAAEGVVSLVNAQLERSIRDYNHLSQRVDSLEEALIREKGKTENLRMQLGTVRKRVLTLEDFIRDRGWEVPPPDPDDRAIVNGEDQ